MDGTPRYLEFQDWDLPQSRAGVRPDGTPYARVRGTVQELPGWRTERFEYTKQDPAAVEVLRKRFENTGRANFCEHLALQHRDELKQAGLTDEQIEILSHGGVPDGYEVHHVRPLDGGGTNGFDNLLLMRKRPDHATVTAYQATVRAGMQPGEARMVQWPVPPAGSVVWPPKAGTEPAR